MPKRLTAALAALLAFAATLAIVPLATSEPAEAHTKTVQRCAFDPFAGNQCWTETVPHTHPQPPTTTQPDPCPPPAHDHGSYGCHWSGDPHTTTPPTTAPPPTTTTTQPVPVCPAGEHRYGNGCHADHGAPPCGTGTWVPHTGHTPMQQSPCPTEPDDDDGDDSGTETDCGHPSQHAHDGLGCHPIGSDHHTDATRCGPRSAEHRHDGSGCHPATLDHCHDGTHSHDGGGCHPTDTEHGRGHDTTAGRCVGRVPSHSHDGYACHSVNTNHCHDGEHSHDGGGCHPTGTDNCPLGEHEHLTEQTSGCHPTGRDHYKPKPPGYFQNIGMTVIAGLLCTGAGLAAGAGTSFTGPGAVAVGTGVTLACAALIATFETSSAKQKQTMLDEAKKRHDAMVKAKLARDMPSSSNTPRDTAAPKQPSTTAKPVAPTTTTAPPPTTTAPRTPKDAWNDALDKFRKREIDYAGLIAARDRYQCAQGITSKCK